MDRTTARRLAKAVVAVDVAAVVGVVVALRLAAAVARWSDGRSVVATAAVRVAARRVSRGARSRRSRMMSWY